MFNLTSNGRQIDLTNQSGGLTENTINIIESNTSTQVDVEIKATSITWLDGVPTIVNKYSDIAKTDLVDSYAITWLDGVPTTIVRTNYDNGIITTTTIEWVDGIPLNITKV